MAAFLALIFLLNCNASRRLPTIRRIRDLTLLNPAIPDPLVVGVYITTIAIMLNLIALVTLKIVVVRTTTSQCSTK
jgi:hypothetical protein